MSDPLEHREMRFQAYLRRISRATRIIGILSIIGSLFLVFVALDMRSESDRVGFSLCAMATMLFGVLVWGTGVFHGAVAGLLPVLASIDFKLERIARLQALGATAKVSVSDPDSPANPFLTASDENAGAPAESERAPTPPPRPPPKKEEPPVVKVPCPSCGGLVHPEASRCVHCMKRITLKRAS